MTEKHQKSHLVNQSLAQWLSYLEQIHPTEIDLGLGRITQVAEKLAVDLSFAKVITVAGTNGKGTTCAFLENALLDMKQRVAVYSSPHIHHFNERLRINKQDVSDTPLISAFEAIETARGDISLTYYEYTTLAALLVLMDEKPDVVILEVGLGGRLDATNLIDADIGVITSIDLDHQAFLGNTRELIGAEKAGIFKANKKAVVGDPNAPQSVLTKLDELGLIHNVRGSQFDILDDGNTWQYHAQGYVVKNLTQPCIPRDNVATAITALRALAFEFSEQQINQWIDITRVPGRTEIFHGHCDVMLDVGHNPHAVRYLAGYVKSKGYAKIHAVVGMLKDKEISATLSEIEQYVDHWYFCSLDVPRGATAKEMLSRFAPANQHVNCFDNVIEGYTMALESAQQHDLVLIFGSFFTVAEVRHLLLNE
ncbi:bifunctional tetrahydrofolate synthase/dihydrofolate synthase [Thalassotalea agarivorans]|uniref:Dihydrofolate synthase/folylpolyglutamate synthase n=1 Tax=Thalassotalea agarivorans TaxID=349064 RepID=A0A1H9ZPG7_THASX|nr:bifunctional tetrahydrofolate synthase/dihydrofolate synthase [Thalassotalea agarivorans]SES83106.1 dihydrofolate synthase / folylpolyglutamate synthase [Thalassotalea agarivorans]